MTVFFQFAVTRLGLAAIYALVAQGLIVIYAGSRVLNSPRRLAMFGAYLYRDASVVHHLA